MKLSFSTNAFVRHSVFDAVKIITAAGYDGVELLADVPHLYAPEVTDRVLGKLDALIGETGIHVANINANTAAGYYGRTFWEPLFEPSLANPNPHERRWRIDYSKQCIDIAHALRCRSVSLTSGRIVPGVCPDDALELLRESMNELLDYAEKKDVRLGIEYEPGLLIECCEELYRFIEDMNSPYLGVNLDVGHSHVLGEDIREVISLLSGKIFHIHIEDIKDRKHYHLIPGHGDMNFPAIFTALEDQSYNGFVTVELYTYPHKPEEAARGAFAYLSAIKETEDRDDQYRNEELP